jgi:asparaginyl-tRNA synthetase
MKSIYVANLQHDPLVNKEISLLGWVGRCRTHGSVLFLDAYDSTGSIQAVLEKNGDCSEILFDCVKRLPPESAVRIDGILIERMKNGKPVREIKVKSVSVISRAVEKPISSNLRNQIDIFDPSNADHLLRNRHLYIRNEKVMAILRFRHVMMGGTHQWFRDNGFTEITAPILTPLPLYDNSTAIPVDIHGEKVFLTQCVGFYLESAVHAFEKVYNIGPSFRNEESRSKRHLIEYWHIKGELAFGNLNDMISIVEKIIKELTIYCGEDGKKAAGIIKSEFCTDGLKSPFPQISYREAVHILQKAGHSFEFGKSLGSEEESILSTNFDSPFWVRGIPRTIEPFPYVIDPDDPAVTRTADLIASRGYGELLGVAEKITDLNMLDERMREKGKLEKSEYGWLRELRETGCVPHIGFGMGVERFIRWILQFPNVRDAIPFPRPFGRKIYP